MQNRYFVVCAASLFGAIITASTFAQALTMKECSAKYKEAQTAGTLRGMKWNDFRKAECGANATATPASAPATTPSPVSPPKPATTTAAHPSVGPATLGNAVFPNTISQKYSNESAGKARLHTCLDQYNANKANNSNGGLVWIMKGGGYYSECNKHLKG